MHTLNPSRVMDLGGVSVASMGWELFDFAANHAPRDEYTDATIRFIKVMQTSEGNWQAFESRRPPMNTGQYQTAALAIYALKSYSPPTEKEVRIKSSHAPQHGSKPLSLSQARIAPSI